MPTDVPIASGTTLISADGRYEFTYTISNSLSGMIFYSAKQLQPQPQTSPILEKDPQSNLQLPPLVLVPVTLPSPKPVSRPLPGRPSPVRNGFSFNSFTAGLFFVLALPDIHAQIDPKSAAEHERTRGMTSNWTWK